MQTRKMALTVWLLMMGVVVGQPANATTRNVLADGSGDAPTIQAAMNLSVDGDTVLVHPGVYEENIEFGGHAVVLGSLFLTTGETDHIANTILIPFSGDVISIADGESPPAAVIGLTIRHPWPHGYGNGIVCYNGASPLIAGNIISNNVAFYGAGIYCNNASPTIRDNIIRDNLSIQLYNNHNTGYGAGIFCFLGAAPLIEHNVFTGNEALNKGGAVGCQEASPTIDNNEMTGNIGDHGAGIHCGDSAALISHNLIADNVGGGINIWNSAPTVLENEITGNTAMMSGGGLRVRYSDPLVRDNIITDNHTNDHGGGIFCENWGVPIFENNLIMDNTADGFGGGIYCEGEFTAVFAYNTICGNSAFGGGGVGIWNSTGITLTNCTIYGNTAEGGGGLSCSTSDVIVENCIFWADTALYSPEIHEQIGSNVQVECCAVEGGWPGETNIDQYPQFCYTNPAVDLLWTLQSDSPCTPGVSACGLIGAWDVGCSMTSTLLTSFEVQLENSGVRLSWQLADEGDSAEFRINADCNGDNWEVPCPALGAGGHEVFDSLIEIPSESMVTYSLLVSSNDHQWLPLATRTVVWKAAFSTSILRRIHPNPGRQCDPGTTVSFDLDRGRKVTIAIYDIAGRHIDTLADRSFSSGRHDVVWDGRAANGSRAPAGVYLVRLATSDQWESRKIVLAR